MTARDPGTSGRLAALRRAIHGATLAALVLVPLAHAAHQPPILARDAGSSLSV